MGIFDSDPVDGIADFVTEAAVGLSVDTESPATVDLDAGLGDLSDEERAVVSEAGFQSTRKVVVKTKGQKIAALVHQAVMEIARKAGDPVYKQYESHRKQEVLLRRKLEKKYSGQARAVVNQVIKDKK